MRDRSPKPAPKVRHPCCADADFLRFPAAFDFPVGGRHVDALLFRVVLYALSSGNKTPALRGF
jgi:hypothetical protein